MKLSRCIPYLTIVAIITVFVQPLFAQYTDCGITWNTPLQLASDTIPSNFPQVAVSGDTVHVIWLGQDFLRTGQHGGIQYCHSFDGGISFSPQTTISSFDTANTPAFISCSGNNVYIGFFADIDTFHGAVVIRSSDAGETWQSPQRLLKFGFPLILEASGQNVYMQCQIAEKYNLLLSTDYGATWSVNNSNAPPLSSMIATPDKLHGVIATVSPPNDVYYYYSIDLGRNWFFGDVLSREDLTSSDSPRLSWNGDNAFYVVWRDRTDSGNVIMMRRSRNGGFSWLPEIKISEQGGAVFGDVGADEEFVCVAWDMNVGGAGTINIRPSNDFGFTFCPIDSPVSNSSVGESELKISGTSLHLIWSETSNGNGEIVYQRGTLTKNPRIGVLPGQFALKPNYPNPFNGSTHINFDVAAPSHVRLAVYDLLGQRVAQLVNDDLPAGRYDVTFSARNIASGVYFYRLQTPTLVETRKLLITR